MPEQPINVQGDSGDIYASATGDVNVHHHYGAAPPTPPYKPSVFLSYSWNDDPDFVAKLAEDLKAAGIDVWYDRERLEANGNTLRKELRAAIERQARFLPVIGPNALERGRTRGMNIYLEWQRARQLCKPIVLIPRQSPPDDAPADFSAGLYFDFRDDAAYDAKLAELIAAVKKPPKAPGSVRGDIMPAVPPGALPRTTELEQIRAALSPDESVAAITSTVAASGGLGKTTLAVMLTQDCGVRRGFPDGIIWVEVGREATAQTLIEKIAAAFNVDPTQPRTPALLTQLLTGKDCLIVFDDVWQHAPIKDCLVRGPDLRYLITTRKQAVVTGLSVHGGNRITLDYLTPDEGAELIAGRVRESGGAVTDAQRATFRQISKAVGGHTGALGIAAARLDPDRDGPGYAERLLRRLGDVENIFAVMQVGDEREENLERMLSLSYEDLNAAQQRHFRLLGVFAEDGTFDADALAAVWQTDPDSAHDALMDLHGAGLVERSADAPDRYATHSLTRLYARTLQSDEERSAATRRHADYYARLGYKHGDPNEARRLFAETEQMEAAFAWAVEHDADLCFRLAWGYRNAAMLRGRLAENQRRLTAALGLLTGEDEGTQSRRASLQSALADIAFRRGDIRQGERLLTAAKDIMEAIGDKRNVGALLGKLADIAMRRGDLAAAERLFKEAQVIMGEVGEKGQQGVLLGKLAEIAMRRGDLDAAERLFTEEMRIYEQVGDRRGVGVSKGALADIAYQRGDLASAERLRQEAVAIYEEVGDRRGVGVIKGALADIAMRRGDLDAAERLLHEKIAIAREVQDKRDEGVAKGKLADIAMQRGDLAAAERLYKEAQLIMEQVGEKGQQGVLLGKLADIAMRRGDLAAAERLRQEATVIYGQVGDRHGMEISKVKLAQILIQKGERERACALLAEAHAAFAQMGLPEAGQVAQIMASNGCEVPGQPPAPEGMDPQLWQIILQMAADEGVAQQVYAQVEPEQAAQLRQIVEQVRGSGGG